jgi:hypothetical protein
MLALGASIPNAASPRASNRTPRALCAFKFRSSSAPHSGSLRITGDHQLAGRMRRKSATHVASIDLG